MKTASRYLAASLLLILLAGTLAYYQRARIPVQVVQPSAALPSQAPGMSAAQPSASQAYAEPVAQFRQRITKKRFGQYITPTTSPVQPERFTGYHTGVDVEYGDVSTDVPVKAVILGTVTLSQWVSGYGGLLIEKGTLSSKPVYVLYGHLRPSSLSPAGSTLKVGQTLGVLGTAYSQETDGERRHLHLAIYVGEPVDMRGYVQNRSELTNWLDPLTVLP